MDPVSGKPVLKGLLAAVALPSATDTDALSTALLTSGINGFDTIASLCPGLRCLLVEAGRGRKQIHIHASGIEAEEGLGEKQIPRQRGSGAGKMSIEKKA
jgi:thiamine biosynthesis lipoprotein ApbE